MSPLVELVSTLSALEVAGLLSLFVALAVWPAAILAARRTACRDTTPLTAGRTSYRVGRAAVRYTTAVYVGGSW